MMRCKKIRWIVCDEIACTASLQANSLPPPSSSPVRVSIEELLKLQCDIAIQTMHINTLVSLFTDQFETKLATI